MDLGNGGGMSSTRTGSGSGTGTGAGVADLCGGVMVLLFAACSARAAARAGSFLFLSIATACRSECAMVAKVRHIFIGVGRAWVRSNSKAKERLVARSKGWFGVKNDPNVEIVVARLQMQAWGR
jgi:hypothetical protein